MPEPAVNRTDRCRCGHISAAHGMSGVCLMDCVCEQFDLAPPPPLIDPPLSRPAPTPLADWMRQGAAQRSPYNLTPYRPKRRVRRS
jgi:hypothetical protein